MRHTYRRRPGIELQFEPAWIAGPYAFSQSIRRDLVILMKIEDFWLQPDPCEATCAPEVLEDEHADR